MRVAIVIPAKDEEKTIGEVVRSLVREGWKDVFVVDDESLDRTAEVALRTGADIIKLPVALGAFGAIQVGMRYALEKGFDVVVTVDGDMQHKVEFVKSLVDKWVQGLHQKGSRNLADGRKFCFRVPRCGSFYYI